MSFPRVNAAIAVLLLIGCFALLGVGSVVLFGPSLTHNQTEAHDVGVINMVDLADSSFTLLTADHRTVRFQCSNRQCRAALGHMQRHKTEKARTDVFYVVMGNDFLALDVD
jgi:hypothetical protein